MADMNIPTDINPNDTRGEALLSLHFNNRFVRELPADPDTENVRRQVLAACYTFVNPTPVAAPNRTAETHRLPTVSGWRIRDIANGGALIEGREGLYEVYAGDPLPGLGRVDAIRKQDGRWVVVTSMGLIVAR